jgi:hypothetical protein
LSLFLLADVGLTLFHRAASIPKINRPCQLRQSAACMPRPLLLAPPLGCGYDEGVAGAGIVPRFRPATATECVCMSVSRLLSGDSLMPESAVTNDSVARDSLARDSVAPDSVADGATGGAAAPSVWASIQATLAAIRLDSAASPNSYLDDTVVPHGGE